MSDIPYIPTNTGVPAIECVYPCGPESEYIHPIDGPATWLIMVVGIIALIWRKKRVFHR